MNLRARLIFQLQTALLSALLSCSATALAKTQGSGLDTPPVLSAKEVLPPALIQGEHFRVLDRVTTFESLHQFKVKTDWGTLDVYGEPLLRIRLKEVRAINALKNTSSVSVGAKAAKDTALKSAKHLGKAIAHPVETAKALPGGIARMFTGVVRDADEVVDAAADVKEEYEEEGMDQVKQSSLPRRAELLAGKYTGINKEYREWSQAVGVDPYTTNPLLKKELQRVAVVDTAVSFGTGFVLPALPGAAGLLADVSESAYKKEWRELFDDNAKAMGAMGASPKLIYRFTHNNAMTPTLMTLIVKALGNMQGVKDRRNVIEQASLLKSEAEALFFAECVMMAEWFHNNETRLRKMLLETLIPVGLTVDGRVVAFSAADYAYWDKLNASLAKEFTSRYDKYANRREVLAADKVSPRFVQGMKGLGWSVRSDLRSRVLPEIPWGLQDTGKAR